LSSELLEVRDLSAAWGATPVLRSISFGMRAGEFVTLLGPNGSGKSTLLRCLAGLEEPRTGSIRLAGRELRGVPPHRRGLGLVAQEPSLFPHRTVRENIAYGPYVRRFGRRETERRVRELLDQFGLRPFAERYPAELSGGEQQRVALARTLAPDPPLVLLDEPFAAVDPELRAELRGEFREILGRRGATAIHVTHDRDEGLFLGGRLFLLLDGRLVHDGPPLEVLLHPGTVPIARFLGYNLLPEDGRTVGVLPEEVEFGPGPHAFEATVAASGPSALGWTVLLRTRSGVRVEVHRPRNELPPPLAATVVAHARRAEPLRPE
jgi:ABC-type Fe3+/spermidine/putrescine transport system ATPase subunit